MINLQKYIIGDNNDGAPQISLKFEETQHSSEWTSIQYIVDFLSATGFSAETISALQTLVDSNTPAE